MSHTWISGEQLQDEVYVVLWLFLWTPFTLPLTISIYHVIHGSLCAIHINTNQSQSYTWCHKWDDYSFAKDSQFPFTKSEEWGKWKSWFRLASGLEAEECQVSTLLYCVGEESWDK